MKLSALIACAVLMSPLVANAQNAPAPGAKPDLPGVAANTNQPAPAPGMQPAPRPNPALGQPGAIPNPAPAARPGQPGARPMPGRPGMQPAPRIITTAEAVKISGGETGEVVIYNGIRISVPPGGEATLSMDNGSIKVEADNMDGITIGNATYSSTDPNAPQAEQPAQDGEQGEQAEQPQQPAASKPAVVLISPVDGSVSVPEGGASVFVTVSTGDNIEINKHISLKGDVSGALSQVAPVVTAVPETPAEQPQQPAQTTTAVPPAQQQTSDSNASSKDTSSETQAPAGETYSDDTENDFIETVDQEVAPTVAEEAQGENIKEENILSPSVR